ncbi:Maf family protein [Mycolicibacterium vanbaalenii]|uniref:Nucleoside triphosphate pyrophosphatase n=1 Tax=Mycolicibacterium vanbaalenii (strain DSM 7251 / JCM 13017 / BCRC 16820 / KCTC 9966 / NRRL B-24157 / PYR-1) TaxID=350058 RepID=NTPP_MYCVP|nr:nucleoside triphosphate pyrophosphatase [Mycolicibacterium vanbaalenii]A1T5Q3.1 RecName: Full=Nucleoside triphosphate pyrophosphatase; AltName: Full=Nucleotide pyrophosphatase; Short=Nucleotide PPase [Mycolicibacterium vanbaalenii PYR-1]ABM12503.1 maf protein [Mycolicibacterium vanbaalenii PYR-1]MCV7129767.1 septum formation inhibitor Maf [Mycolicibacterium vanbaalenii PYR-1]
MTRVVLASASKGRLGVLRQAGIDPQVIVSAVDEDTLLAALDPDLPPEAVVAKLATAKALSVAAELPDELLADCVVIGCDSMLFLDGTLRGKPGSAEAARAQWESMAGSAGHLLTGHALLRISGGVITHTEGDTGSTKVHFGKPAEDEITRYVDSGEPIHVAGAFTLNGLGGWFVDRIEGDPSNVIGLSLPLVHRLVRRTGLSISDLWQR